MTIKLFLVKPLLFALLVLSGIGIAFAQDSTPVKTAKPVVKPAIKPVLPAASTAKYPYRAVGTTTPPGTPPQVPAANPPQYAETPVSTDKSLAGQYQYVLSKTYHYQQPMVAALWKNINDTLVTTKKNLKTVQTKLSAQNKTLDSLRNDIKSLENAGSNQDSISLMGTYVTKTTYSLTMWGLVVVLGLALLIIILKTGGASREAKYRTTLYEELNEEFTAYKAKAADKERKLARELQTERNKVDELMGRG
jgi:hypothetical protein